MMASAGLYLALLAFVAGCVALALPPDEEPPEDWMLNSPWP